MKCLAILGIAMLACSIGFAAYGDVVLTDNGSTVTLSNDVVSGTFQKAGNRFMVSLKKGSTELMSSGGIGYLDVNWTGGYIGMADAVYSIVKNNANFIEIKYRHEANTALPFTVELHYVLRRDDSGFYIFATFEHDKRSMANPTLIQTRYVLQLDGTIFDHESIDDERQWLMPTQQEVAQSVNLYGGVCQLPDGSYWDKYWRSVCLRHHHVHGLNGQGGSQYFGVYTISASNEYVTGGPRKQELSVHQTPSGPVIQSIFQGSHYNFSVMPFADEDWKKIYGPFFIYVNTSTDSQSLWANAKNRTQIEIDNWPYSWMDHCLYPLSRGTVVGKLKMSDGSSPAGACVLLAKPSPDWQQQGKGYIFWTDADADGMFTLQNVRMDTYTLYAFVSGVFGEFRFDGVQVSSGGVTDLGELVWTPQKNGEKIWQIGVPDCSAAEFKHGDDYRHAYLWQQYPIDFPNDINFVVGQSDPRQDWNFVHQPVKLSGGQFRLPVWNINFEMPLNIQADQAVLTIAIASASYGSGLNVAVNGTAVAQYDTLFPYDGTNVGAGIYGVQREKIITFNTSLLKAGVNTISLRQTCKNEFAGIMYDALRFEIKASGDLNLDKRVNSMDLADFMQDWLTCTDPNGQGCRSAF